MTKELKGGTESVSDLSLGNEGLAGKLKRLRLNAQFAYAPRTAFLLMAFVLFLPSCRQADPETERRAALKLTADSLRRCLPPVETNQPAGLAIAAIARERDTETTTLRMVVYATTEPVEFHLPIYLMSRGRWMINDTGRAYLLDEHCRERTLKGTAAVNGKTLPREGVVKLQAGESFEFRLNFPTLPETMQMGALVYGSRVLPFSFLVETR
jgi:hypothetical protein